MAISQERSIRKPSGARLKGSPRKRIANLGRKPTFPTLGELERKTQRTRGANEKTRLLSFSTVNLYDPKTKKNSNEKILKILENKASPHFVRRNILTKGTIVETGKGKARILSRPGQEGSCNAVLI